MADHAVERLQRQVAPVQAIEHAHALNVVEEPAAVTLAQAVVEEALPGMAEGGVPDVVTKRDGLDQVEVEAQGATDVARHAGHELHMQAATREVVVGVEREDLRLARESVVCGRVHDLLGIAHERGSLEGGKVAGVVATTKRCRVGRGILAATRSGDLADRGARGIGQLAAHVRRAPVDDTCHATSPLAIAFSKSIAHAPDTNP